MFLPLDYIGEGNWQLLIVFSICSFLLIMPAYSAKDSALAVKLVTGFPENEKQGLPSFIGNVMVLDPRNGLPQAVS